VSRKQWVMIEPTIKAFFTEADGLWHHARIDQDLEKVREKLEQNSRAGRASAAVRLNGRSTDVDDPLQQQEPVEPRASLCKLSNTSKKEKPSMKEEFKELWSVIWQKVGTGDAERAYIKQRRAGHSAELIREAAIKQGPALIEAAALRGSSVLHPATWLNQARFLDEDFAKDIPKPYVNGKPPVKETPLLPPDTRTFQEKFPA